MDGVVATDAVVAAEEADSPDVFFLSFFMSSSLALRFCAGCCCCVEVLVRLESLRGLKSGWRRLRLSLVLGKARAICGIQSDNFEVK